jgi:thiol-disulfide isomerase/thioredoxin
MMKNKFVSVLVLCIALFVNNAQCVVEKVAPIVKIATVEDAYMGLSQGPLTNARLELLPKGTLLRAGKVILLDKQLSTEIAKGKPETQSLMKNNSFFILEQMATKLLLTEEARVWAKSTKRDTKKEAENSLVQSYLASVSSKVTVTDVDTKTFYDANKEMMGDASYDEVKKDLKSFLLDQKKQEAVDNHVNTLSKRVAISMNSDWMKVQAAVMLDNPVDKARRSGKPVMVDFGADGCRPCDMMAPILEELKKTYKGNCEIIFVHVREEQVLASRYGISSIPVQVFFDKNGKEVFRHTGFFAKDKIIEQLGKLGVK